MPKSASGSTAFGKIFRRTPKTGRESSEGSTQMASNATSPDGIKEVIYNKQNSSSPNPVHDYMERFLYNDTYAAPQVKYIATEIDPEIEWKIRRILFCRKKGRVCSLKAFINNVLAAHLEEYADVINHLKL